MYTLTFSAYCGMSWKITEGDLESCRTSAAKVLRNRKLSGHPIVKLKENKWECQESENNFLIPDTAGILTINEIEEPEEEIEEDYE